MREIIQEKWNTDEYTYAVDIKYKITDACNNISGEKFTIFCRTIIRQDQLCIDVELKLIQDYTTY